MFKSRFLLPVFFIAIIPIQVLSQQIDEQFKPAILSYPKIKAAVVQNDGKVIIAGDIVLVGNTIVNGIARLNTDGTLDNSFSASPFLAHDAWVFSLSIESSGKILVSGHLAANTYAVRLNADGSIDESFKLDSSIKQIFKAVALSDGRFLILSASPKPLSILKNDGSLDPTFNAGAGPDGFGVGNDLSVQTDGKIIFGGNFSKFNDLPAHGIIRLNTDGSVDNSFAVGAGPQGSPPYINSIAVQSDGKIVLAGSFTNFNNVNAKYIIRLLPDGSVDPNFILPGPAANFFNIEISSIKLFDNGILLAAVRTNNAGGVEYAAMKLKDDGSIDTGFNLTPSDITANSIDDPILLTHQDKIFYTGYFAHLGSVPRSGIAMLEKTGEVNPSFNPTLGSLADIRTIKVQSDGKVLIGGKIDFVGDIKVKNLIRLNPDGTLDTGFLANLGEGPDEIISCLQIDESGKILVGGGYSKFNGVNTGQLIRLNTNGSRDNTFGANIPLVFAGMGINAIELLPGGTIVAGGVFETVNGATINNLVALNNNGTTNSSFNNQLLMSSQRVYTIARQSDNVIVGGESWPDLGGGFLLKTTDHGVVIKNFSNVDFSNQAIRAIKVLPNDSFLVGGGFSKSFSDNEPNSLYQFNKDGELVDKISVAVYAGNILSINTVSTDEVLLTGTFKKVNSVAVSGFTKVKLNGSVNPSYNFSVRGQINTAYKVDNNRNKFFVAGLFSRISGVNFFSIAKINLDVPFNPQNPVSTQDDSKGRITLNWTDGSDNESGFEILRGLDNVFVSLDSVNANSISFIDSTALPLKTYVYKVRAFNQYEVSQFANPVSVSTQNWKAPGAPGNLTQTIQADFSKATISWTDVSDNESGFELERSLANTAFMLRQNLNKNISSFTDDFTFDTKYRYRIRSYNRFGKSEYSPILELPVILDAEEDKILTSMLYPNPARDKVFIAHESEKDVHVIIHDTKGNIFLKQTSSDKIIALDLQDMPAGIYIVNLMINGKSITFKLAKL